MNRPAIWFEVYKAKDGWHWRMLSKNGKPQAHSAEPYQRPYNAKRAIARFLSLTYKMQKPYVEEVR